MGQGYVTNPTNHRDSLRRVAAAALLIVSVAAPRSTAAQERMYFPAVENVTNVLVQHINAETERIDMSAWYLTEHSVSIALVNRFNAGVPIRLIGDRVSIFESDPITKREFYWLAARGIPIRLRYHPTWFPEINHWKATIFSGQNLVTFGSANYTPFELAPASATDYKDETVLFTNDAAIVNAFRTKFDRFWADDATEPNSRIGSPPYFMNWDAACDREPACADYDTLHPPSTRVNMVINPARQEGNHPLPPEMVWSQGSAFNTRLVQEINAEQTAIDLVVYRLTVDSIANALLSKFQSGVPIRLIIEPTQYASRVWPEYWLTHAYVDKLWAAGVPMRQRLHQGLTHMKLLVTSRVATNASSNVTANWQRDHNYFIPAATKPALYTALKNRFATMWSSSGFTTFTPTAPDAAGLAAPGAGATGVSTTPTFSWNRAPFAVSYDVYVGTSSGSMTFQANVPAVLTNDPPLTYSWRPTTPLQGNTTYFWRIVSRTFAADRNPIYVANSATRSFTTAGGGTPPPPNPGTLPSPWQSQDVGSVAQPGSASASNGVFSVRGAGSNIWGSSDGFRYVYQPTSGDTQITARVTAIQNTSQFAKAGVMLRSSVAGGSAHVSLSVRPNGSLEFMTRSSNGGQTTFLGTGTQSPPAWVRLSRVGSTVTASVSANGSTWTTVGTTTVGFSASALSGLIVCSNSSALNMSTFDNVAVSGSPSPPPPPPSASNIVIYANDVPNGSVFGSWSKVSDATSPNGVKLTTPDAGVASTASALASPTHYFDVTFNAAAATPYRLWIRMRARNNNKFNDAVWVQFSNALANGSPVFRTNTTSGLLVNLATDSTAASLSNWGWQNGAYWLSQATAVTFGASGSQTLRIQIREDGVEIDQIVLSPSTYFNNAPGPVSNDSTIVPKP